MNDKDKIEQLERKIDDMQKEFTKFKNDLMTEMVKQQGNTREPIRSDKGQVILKKNAEITSRKGLSGNQAGIERVLSMYFNDAASEGDNVIYIGADGGNEKNFSNSIVNFIGSEKGKRRSYSINSYEVDKDGNRVITGKDSLFASAALDGAEESALLTKSNSSSFSGLGNYTDIKTQDIFPDSEDKISFVPWISIQAKNLEPVFSIYPGKTIKVVTHDSNFNPTERSGVTYTGTVGVIQVTNGIITSVSPPSE